MSIFCAVVLTIYDIKNLKATLYFYKCTSILIPYKIEFNALECCELRKILCITKLVLLSLDRKQIKGLDGKLILRSFGNRFIVVRFRFNMYIINLWKQNGKPFFFSSNNSILYT